MEGLGSELLRYEEEETTTAGDDKVDLNDATSGAITAYTTRHTPPSPHAITFDSVCPNVVGHISRFLHGLKLVDILSSDFQFQTV